MNVRQRRRRSRCRRHSFKDRSVPSSLVLQTEHRFFAVKTESWDYMIFFQSVLLQTNVLLFEKGTHAGSLIFKSVFSQENKKLVLMFLHREKQEHCLQTMKKFSVAVALWWTWGSWRKAANIQSRCKVREHISKGWSSLYKYI